MNRSALKSAGLVLLGVAAGCAIGRPPWWRNSAVGTVYGRVQDAAVPGGSGAGYDSGQTDSDHGARTREPDRKPSRERVEMLAAKFRDRTEVGGAARMRLILDAAQLSVKEIGPVMEALLPVEDLNWEIMPSLAVRWGMLDPKAALDFAASQVKLRSNGDVMASIVQELAKVDLPAAKAALNRLERPASSDAGQAIVRTVMQGDARAALAYARELRNDAAETEVLSFMAEKDPLAATAELTLGKEDQKWVVVEIADALLGKDRMAFEEWANGLKDPNYKAVARFRALAKEVMIDPKKLFG
ncbi:MAG: hypothetical protein JWM59_4323 [Verrucomicrobiales bacterium]|nr:hypothetical protein [Verrucomicrobiales bacterium]